MWLLNTDYLSLLQRGGSTALLLQVRLRQVPVEEVGTTGVNYTTIVNYEEQMRGWLAEAAKANTPARVRDAYTLLEEHIKNFQDLEVLSFGAEPSNQCELLRQAKIRIGTKDLQIAAICLATGAATALRCRSRCRFSASA